MSKKASEFIEFDGVAPICIEGWDAAIFTLKHAPENRRPVSMTPRPAEELNDLDIVVVGYPQAYRISKEIEQVTEDSPIFGVKRYSEGKIFKHSTDDGNPYGVETLVDPAGENIAEAIAKITKVVTDITDAKPLLNNKLDTQQQL